jgi:hypothetical protein
VRRRIRSSSHGPAWVPGLLLLALGLTAACTSAPNQKGAAATTPPAAPSVSAPPTTSPPLSPATHVAPTGGDPAIYAAAISEIQSYLTMEVQHGPYAA